MLPQQVRLIPMYVFFQKLGWIDTLLPLIVPQFFANAYDVFLLRQFFMSIPLEMDDASRIDGANPIQTLLYVILPQARPALVAVSVFHFLYAWNDFYEPLIYLHSRENWTLAVGLQTFNALYAVNTHLIMAASVVMILPPIILFFLSQRIFTQGVVFSGVKG
jgi:ABC-type glycerol-3-phosphate transport system permease component